MTYYEGILLSSDKFINASAAGADVKEDTLRLNIYSPSDTARNLSIGSKFTFSLTRDLELFFRASLTGHDEPEKIELSTDDMLEKDGYYYPKEATKTYFCEVIDIAEKEGEDEFGRYTIKKIIAEIISERGEKEYLTRENPYLDSMVYASRIPVSDEEQRKKIKKKVNELLKNKNDDLARRIKEYVKGEN